MGVVQHCVSQLLAQLATAVQLLVGQEEEGDDEDGHQPHLDEEGQFELHFGTGTLLSVEMMMAVIP